MNLGVIINFKSILLCFLVLTCHNAIATRYYVDTAGSNASNGLSWGTAKKDLQNAIDAASSGDTIWVASGKYVPTESPDGVSSDIRDKAFHWDKDIVILGGFAGTETQVSQRDRKANNTILDADLGGASSDSCYHVIVTSSLTAASVLDGFVIENGRADGSGNISYDGAFIPRSRGAGMYNVSSSLSLKNVVVSNNKATTGGGIYNYSSSISISNTVFSENTVTSGAGAIFNVFSSPNIINSTFIGNTASSGGAIYNASSSSPTIANCIFWKNEKSGSVSATGADIENASGTPSVTYSSMQISLSGTGNIVGDPLFIDDANAIGTDNIWMTADDGLMLKATSSAIDKGNNTGVSSTDIIGYTRIQYGTVNMGAYEHVDYCPTTTGILYVDSSGRAGRDGTSGRNAFLTLSEALYVANRCNSINRIIIAKGTYYPDSLPYERYSGGLGAQISSSDVRNKTFHIRPGLSIEGGYSRRPNINNRDISANPTILSGVISSGDTAYHVLLVDDNGKWQEPNDSVRIDGLTILGGRATGNDKLTLNTALIEQENGAGIYSHCAKTYLSNMTIKNNTASLGGGLYADSLSNVTIVGSKLQDNIATAGGAIFSDSSSIYLENSSLTSNSAMSDGGAVHCSSGLLYITNSRMLSNTVSSDGGAIHSTGDSIDMDRVVFAQNSANSLGGGLDAERSVVQITNSLFYKNEGDKGGAIRQLEGDLNLINLTFVENQADSGGALYSTQAEMSLTNSLLAFNKINGADSVSGSDISNVSSEVTISHCMLQLDSLGYTSGSHNNLKDNGNNLYAVRPYLSDTSDVAGADSILGTADDGLRLHYTSLATDAGELDSLPSNRRFYDLAGSDRVIGTVNLGAYEIIDSSYKCEGVNVLYVDSSFSGVGDGESWTSPLSSLSLALRFAHECTDIDSILVAKGTYTPDYYYYVRDSSEVGTMVSSNDEKSKTFHVRPGLSVLGGYPTGGGVRDPDIHKTILSGQLATGDSVYHVVYMYIEPSSDLNWTSSNDSAKLDGVTVQRGRINSSDNTTRNGAGILIGVIKTILSNVVVQDCYIQNVSQTWIVESHGGGCFAESGELYIRNSIFKNNEARYGGGLALRNSKALLSNVRFEMNSGKLYGGGMYTYGNSSLISFSNGYKVHLDNVHFDSNNGGFGGGLYLENQKEVLINNTVFANNVGGSGSGIRALRSEADIQNAVFSKNIANSAVGGYAAAVSFKDKFGNGATSKSRISNALFIENRSEYGQCIEAGNGPIISVSSTTFYNNWDIFSSSYSYSILGDGDINVSNSIHWDDDNIFLSPSYTGGQDSGFVYSLTKYNYAKDGKGVKSNLDPLFVNRNNPIGLDSLWFTADDGLRLMSGSPAMNAGINDSVPKVINTDISRAPRIVDGNINMGAYEDSLYCSLKNPIPKRPIIHKSAFAQLDSATNDFTCYCDSMGQLLLALDTNGSGAIIDKDSISLKIGDPITTSWVDSGGLITNLKGGAIINRQWNVAPDVQPNGTVKIKFYFREEEYQSVKDTLANHNGGASGYSTQLNSVSDLAFYKLTTPGRFLDPHQAGVQGVILTNGSAPSLSQWFYEQTDSGNHSATFLVNSFSGGGGAGGGGNTALPVELLDFTSLPLEGHRAVLDWTTAMELNNSHFEIERSFDGSEFELIGKVDGAGSSNRIETYSFFDRTIPKHHKVVYYRLKQVDFNGEYAHSHVEVIRFANLGIEIVNVYPNPSKDGFNVILANDSDVKLTVYNSMNQMVLQRKITEGQAYIDLLNERSGVYYVSIETSSLRKDFKLIKL
jgi:predicted outer membrane repeat protein